MREYFHDVEHEIAALAALAEKGDRKARKELVKLLTELGYGPGEADQRIVDTSGKDFIDDDVSPAGPFG